MSKIEGRLRGLRDPKSGTPLGGWAHGSFSGEAERDEDDDICRERNGEIDR
jgi:hypothetical protein